MLDINFIQKNPGKVKKACQDKGLGDEVVDRLLRVDETRRQLIAEIEKLREKRNKLLKKVDKKPDEAIIKKGKKIKETLRRLEPDLVAVEEEFKNLMLQIPNLPTEDVPIGSDEKHACVVRSWGKIPKFTFSIKDHISLGKDLGLIDFARGAKVAGFRGYFLKNEAVLIQMGLMDYTLRKLIDKGFVPFIPPVVDKKKCFIYTGHFPWGEKEAYSLSSGEAEIGKVERGKDIMYLAGTSEVPMIAYHANEIFEEGKLPKKYVAFSPCFRREIGNYGKDTRGLFRLHEFFKIEQVIIDKNDYENSEKWLERLAQNAEEILQELELPYRVMLMPTGDMGEPQIKKYDIEAWMPGRNAYGEVMSDSLMGDFQSRRANIKYKTKNGEMKYCHTLNNTAIASPRILIAILENYQQKDGSIKVPKILQKYVGKEIIST